MTRSSFFMLALAAIVSLAITHLVFSLWGVQHLVTDNLFNTTVFLASLVSGTIGWYRLLQGFRRGEF